MTIPRLAAQVKTIAPLATALGVVLGPALGRGADGQSAAQAPAYVVIVHPATPVVELRRDDLKALFLKRRTRWNDQLPALPVDLAPRIPARAAFSREVLDLSTIAVTTYWMQEIFAGRGEPPPVMSTVSAVVAYVAATPGAIGYVPGDAETTGVRVVRMIP